MWLFLTLIVAVPLNKGVPNLLPVRAPKLDTPFLYLEIIIKPTEMVGKNNNSIASIKL